MGGGDTWKKMKLALGLKLNSCLYMPRTLEEFPGDAPATSPARRSEGSLKMPPTPTPSSSGLQVSRHGGKSSSKRTCAICLTTMKLGSGHAIFTAECSHSFHFHCITSNVKHGNRICPVCRAKWKEVPSQNPVSDISLGKVRMHRGSWSQDESWMAVQRVPSPRTNAGSVFPVHEPAVFDDDELIVEEISPSNVLASNQPCGPIELKTYPEISAISNLVSHNNFAILIHLKAPVASRRQSLDGLRLESPNSRAPVDLVTLLDVSGSMAGTKLALLKQAMGFVIQNLGPSDRLSVISFSSSARRLFPLRRMTEIGKQEALQAINSLTSNGGTNISEALRKGSKVMSERKSKNPVSSLILLSDGQDTYTFTSPRRSSSIPVYQNLLPSSMHLHAGTDPHTPVHTFGIGADHDAVAMHAISEASGGTFSFIEANNSIQDAFAQCIGGILSVVVQELRVVVKCPNPVLRLRAIKAGSYKVSLASDSSSGSIEVGDLYAEEERDFLITMDIPVDASTDEMSLVNVCCTYKDPMSKEKLDIASDVKILRSEVIGEVVISMEVDRQRNRLKAVSAIAEARTLAECGNLSGAVSVLEKCGKELSESVSAQDGDRLCFSLIAELREMQERMVNLQTYESTGRSYVLSGLSSHSWQRATARGDSTEVTTTVQTYQTPSMVDMVNLSHTMFFGPPGQQMPVSLTTPIQPR